MVNNFQNFISGAAASCFASTFTNPIEVVKTRLQLQGELMARGEAKRVYHGTFESLALIARSEGLRGVQRGLFAAYWYQISLNGARLGLYEPFRQQMNKLFGIDPLVHNHAVSIVTGALSGALASVPASPFYLIKVRMQSYSPVFASVGDQTKFTSILDGFRYMVKTGGLRGLWQGLDSAALKLVVISSTQMPSYNFTKATLEPYIQNCDLLYAASSLICSIAVSFVMNPFDVVMTRLYNQKGKHYAGIADCFVKTVRLEGLQALYKGIGAQIFRSGGQVVFTLVAMEKINEFWKAMEERDQQKTLS